MVFKKFPNIALFATRTTPSPSSPCPPARPWPHALLLGSAVNQDGRTATLTAPNGPSQEAVLASALQDAGVPAAAVGYVECHGTGTALGDPIEVAAQRAVVGRDRTAPLVVGAVKTNMGHQEGGAGTAGLLKAVLAVQRRVVPPNLHFEELNPMGRAGLTHVGVAIW